MICKKCGQPFQSDIVIEGRKRSLKNRANCLACVPFGKSIYSRRPSRAEKLQAAAAKQRRWRDRQIRDTGVCPIRARRQAKKQMIVELLGGCQVCGYSKCARNLTFHHVHDKSIMMTERAFQCSWNKILLELAKCVLLCANHHGEVHDGLIDVAPLNAVMVERLRSFDPGNE